MLRLPRDKRSHIQIALLLGLLTGVYLAARLTAFVIGSNADAMELQDAVRLNDAPWLHSLLRDGANVNAKYYGSTALQTAVGVQNWDAAIALLEHGANPNQPLAFGTLLHYTVNYSDEVSHLLIKRGAHIDIKDKDGRTPLHIAAAAGNVEMVRVLVEHGAPLHGVCSGSQPGTPTYLAVKFHFKDEAAEYLIREIGPALTQSESTTSILNMAVARGHAASIVALLELDPSLVSTLRRNQPALLTTLVERNDSVSIAKLLDMGFEPDAPFPMCETALHAAARYDSASVAKTLIERGANLNARTTNGKTPLLLAVEAASPDVLEVLLEYGADLSITDAHQIAPMDLARLRTTYQRENGIWDDARTVYAVLERHANAQTGGVGE